MNQFIDLTGKRFSRWLVIKHDSKRKKEHYWLCRCDCGNEKITAGSGLRHGNSKSCGCYNRERVHEAIFIDLTNQRFGRLVAVKLGEKVNLKYKWVCKCDCGNEVTVAASSLRKRLTRSCGCYQKEKIHNPNYKHGLSKTAAYKSWRLMIRRCFNKDDSSYLRYGGRGISVCDRWVGAHGLENFISDMGTRPSNLTIDRIDNNGNYEPNNCRWGTSKQQAGNRSNNRWIEANGKRMIATNWALELKVSVDSFFKYLQKHTIHEAIQFYTK